MWPGRVAFPDFTDPATRAWWAGHYRASPTPGVGGHLARHERAGLHLPARGSDPAPVDARHDFDGRGGDHGEGHNLYGLLMNRAGYEGLALAPSRSPALHRVALGVGRHAALGLELDGRRGQSTWASMRQQIATVVGLGLSGVPYSGPDIGGFSGVPDDELYLRWLQMSVFMPTAGPTRCWVRPGANRGASPSPTRSASCAWIRFRYRLLPYLYTLAHEAAVSGAPLVRPLWWPPPGDIDDIFSTELARRGLGDQDDAFKLGDALLVAPVVEPGARTRRVVLPPGSWKHLWDCDEIVPGRGAGHDPGAHEGGEPSGADGPGGVAVEMSAPADRLPVLVRSGTILPLDDGFADPSGPCRLEGDAAASVPEGRLGMDHAPRLLSFHCWPSSRGTARGLCTDDAGDGFGPVRRDELRLEGGVSGSTAVLTWLRNGEFPPPSRVRVVIHGGDSSHVVADGHDIGGTVCGSIECVPFHRLELRDLTPAGRPAPPAARP